VKQLSDSDNNNGSAGAFFTGVLAGAVLGAGIGLWFAPKAGTDMREDLAGQARDLSQRVSKTVGDLADRGRDAFDRARDVVVNAGDQVDKAANDASKAIDRARRDAQNVAQAAERS